MLGGDKVNYVLFRVAKWQEFTLAEKTEIAPCISRHVQRK